MSKKKDILSFMSNLQPNCCLKFDFQKVDQYAGDKWLIHDTKPRLKLGERYSSLLVDLIPGERTYQKGNPTNRLWPGIMSTTVLSTVQKYTHRSYSNSAV